MLTLVPPWAHHYGEFWRAIRVRNLWFIKLRYGAVLLLVLFLLGGNYILQYNFSPIQVKVIASITFFILLYNSVIHALRFKIGCDPNKFNCLHTSLIQMICDILALMLLVYFTGMLKSPFYFIFVFHMIIGSMILPGYVVYCAAVFIIVVFSFLVWLQGNGVIPLHNIPGITDTSSLSFGYNFLFIILFSFMLFGSVYIANKIARQLYFREQQLRGSLEKLKEADVTKQKYTLGIVHEIKTPIAAVKSILDLLIGNYAGPISNEANSKLQRANIRTTEALEFINDVLRYSKIKLLDTKVIEEIDLENLIRGILEKNIEKTLEKEIKITFVDKRTVKRSIQGDKIILALAFSNIISNSVKYVSQKGIIDILIYDSKEIVFIEINDSGIGIPKGELTKVFDEFYRATNVEKSKREGSGIGLNIVKEIIDRHHGKIEIQSPSKVGNEECPGTGVIIQLPYQKKHLEVDNVTCEEYS